ncbi:MAG: GNAT family N-acetyltransferase [Paracoccaceae bacterium]
MLFKKRHLLLQTDRLDLRLPQLSDHKSWSRLRLSSKDFLTPWEPTWTNDHLLRRPFVNRVNWAKRSMQNGTAIPLFIIGRNDGVLMGAITLDNIRRGPNQTATMGYWIGSPYVRQGFMSEAIVGLVNYAFGALDISRIESACLPENTPSRKLLEKCGFKYEGVAQAYIQIDGRWRTHVLYASIRYDRRGKTDTGVV